MCSVATKWEFLGSWQIGELLSALLVVFSPARALGLKMKRGDSRRLPYLAFANVSLEAEAEAEAESADTITQAANSSPQSTSPRARHAPS